MSAATNLKRRGAVYYCRRRIPKGLTGHYGGKQELCVSLHTKNLREARKRANEQWMQWEAEFEALGRSNGAAQPVTELTDEQIQALAAEHLHGILHWDEHYREQGLSEGDYTAPRLKSSPTLSSSAPRWQRGTRSALASSPT